MGGSLLRFFFARGSNWPCMYDTIEFRETQIETSIPSVLRYTLERSILM
jgi:hypothetical protein